MHWLSYHSFSCYPPHPTYTWQNTASSRISEGWLWVASREFTQGIYSLENLDKPVAKQPPPKPLPPHHHRRVRRRRRGIWIRCIGIWGWMMRRRMMRCTVSVIPHEPNIDSAGVTQCDLNISKRYSNSSQIRIRKFPGASDSNTSLADSACESYL
jgi:hypothetical protein